MNNIYNNNYIEKPKEYFKKSLDILNNFNSMIDIGCANGSYLNYINTIYNNKDLNGIDINNNTTKKNFNFINENFIEYNNFKKYDLVTCFGVLSYHENIQVFFENLVKFMHRNSSLIIFDNINIIDYDFNIKYKNSDNLDNKFEDKYFSYWYSKKTFINLAKKYNMNIEFIPFNMPFDIKKTDDPSRAYTKNINNIHKEFVYNDFPLNFHFIKFTYKPLMLMFHHFHNIKDTKYVNGSCSTTNLENIILKIGKENIIDFDLWIEKYNNNTLKSEICFTFDDGLISQYKYALPILEKYNIKVKWSIITNTLNNNNINLEELKYIESLYDNKKEFYDLFKSKIKKKYSITIAKNYRNDILFYTDEDRIFKYLRDKICNNDDLNDIIKSFNIKIPHLFINNNMLNDIINKQHTISNHTHNHLLNFSDLNYEELFEEINIAKTILNNPNYFTLPFGKDNENIKDICNKLNIQNIIGINNYIQRVDYNIFI